MPGSRHFRGMSLPLRRVVARLRPRRRHYSTSKRLSSTSIPDAAALDSVSPIFTQTPPLWAMLSSCNVSRGSAIDITWNHWATLVKDLEAVAEKNRQNAAAAVEAKRNEAQSDIPAGSSSTFVQVDTTKDQSSTSIMEPSSSTPVASPSTTNADAPKPSRWEIRPTWQRSIFCGVYVIGWAFSTAYLLKYRQTYVTRLKFFRGPTSSNMPSSPPPPPLPAKPTTNSTAAALTPEAGLQDNRFIHIETASHPKGITIPLRKVSLYDGRNETELVIRSNSGSITKSRWRWNRTGREYWFMSLSGALVDGTRYTQVESARDKILQAWFGEVEGKKKKKRGGKKNSRILS
ncbi:hypothetical protein AGABI1DRAFT_106064 [Agaricus bisporus var. burnettii JB137-S8]|uniref:Uncharacterized protein n=1 Tax=Agaricus bisporus var. burnettii (strain JB137-S8 / ATCC MYA-4627 / FGSC 10392) TaxID=597362 RepID=K5X0J2_AGABU|nr:uncharacterized protein AGABI1DRAFT_106064 [Agaricus bisporus var. burnettii JB137-S8]EKM81321.1 hypothetical protein AGABI1DRAFT_106064 [Agaricus bisporus var. burnettii JB137-S8]